MFSAQRRDDRYAGRTSAGLGGPGAVVENDFVQYSKSRESMRTRFGESVAAHAFQLPRWALRGDLKNGKRPISKINLLV